jgi:cysteine desulfurase
MTNSRDLYFDHNATTGPTQEVLAFCQQLLASWGNPSSVHASGRGPKVLIRDARLHIAQLLNISPLEIIFTAGGSESNNTVLKGAWLAPGRTRDRILIGTTEHPAVIKAAESLVKLLGARLDWIPVNRGGQVDLAKYASLLGPDVFLVSQMMANNETGSIYPVGKMCKLAHAAGALFHTDGVQALGKIPVDLKALNVDYASFAGHKFYALKGSGVLFVKKGAPLEPLIHGGGQERGRRAGTENVLAISSLGLQASHAAEIIPQGERLAKLRDELEQRLMGTLGNIQVTGGEVLRLPNTSNLIINGVDGEVLLMNLDMEGARVSTGAACSSGAQEPSPVLRAMGLNHLEAQSSLRISMGWETTSEEVEKLGDILIATIGRLRALQVGNATASAEAVVAP